MHDVFIPYLKNPDGSLRKDSLGRRIHINQKSNGGRKSEGLDNFVYARLPPDLKERLRKASVKDKINMSEKVRQFIEWGLENENTGR